MVFTSLEPCNEGAAIKRKLLLQVLYDLSSIFTKVDIDSLSFGLEDSVFIPDYKPHLLYENYNNPEPGSPALKSLTRPAL